MPLGYSCDNLDDQTKETEYSLKTDVQIKAAQVLFRNLHVFEEILASRKAQHVTENLNTHLHTASLVITIIITATYNLECLQN